MNFVGHLDGIRNGEIYGWALDAGNPLEPVKLTVQINHRRAAELLAVYYRPDVAERMNSSGRHGFYLDLAKCWRHAGDIAVDVRFPNGQSLEGSPIRTPISQHPRERVSSPTLLFIHIPKTAGTAFREAAIPNYKQSEIAYVYADPPGFPWYLGRFPIEQRARLRLVVGHYIYGIHDWIPNECRYFTIVRNPLSRIWSHYNHFVEQNSNLAFTATGEARTLQEMLENRIAVELDNLMVRYFAGVDDTAFPIGTLDHAVYELAALHLDRAFPCVGMQERLDDAYECLRNELGWTRGALPKSMNAASYSSTGRWTAQEEKLMRHFNKWDLMLYERICQRPQPGVPS